MFNNNIDQIIQLFKKNNLKITPQRINIYSYLVSTCEHPTVDTIYKNIKNIMPAISIATIYKTLNTLVESNLVKIINVCEENFRYDANINPHGHIKCTVCKKIKDISVNNDFSYIGENENFHVENFDLFLYGKCNTCS